MPATDRNSGYSILGTGISCHSPFGFLTALPRREVPLGGGFITFSAKLTTHISPDGKAEASSTSANVEGLSVICHTTPSQCMLTGWFSQASPPTFLKPNAQTSLSDSATTDVRKL